MEASRDERHETITLLAETRTPRARMISATFLRECTPLVELPPARRQRKKNEGKARARAMDRLDPVKHEQNLEAERARTQNAALRSARGELFPRSSQKRSRRDGASAAPVELPSPAWKRQARERMSAEQQVAQQRKDERAARGKQAREQRTILSSGARCGSCTTCAQLKRFGGTRHQNGPCHTALSRLEGERGTVLLQVTSEPCAGELAWEDLNVRSARES